MSTRGALAALRHCSNPPYPPGPVHRSRPHKLSCNTKTWFSPWDRGGSLWVIEIPKVMKNAGHINSILDISRLE
ncbi:hypothetical protein M413DRAFT_447611 [Hebeloma cylindrosporum]|uniref:Uncharacterized protein n=1 Tax=Hebeloma cylindrosporum TaxID=76867 RepID=A0A0C3C2Z4_HEBCY|nr:hypothetical protein M413DRAFT_447611 [Hebeloma cylindrosporum h7]